MASSKYTAEQLAHWKRLRARGMKTGDPRRGDAMIFSGMKTAWIPLEEWQPSATNPIISPDVFVRAQADADEEIADSQDYPAYLFKDHLVILWDANGRWFAKSYPNAIQMYSDWRRLKKEYRRDFADFPTEGGGRVGNPTRKKKAAKRPAKQTKKTRGKASTVTTVMTTKTTKTTRRANPKAKRRKSNPTYRYKVFSPNMTSLSASGLIDAASPQAAAVQIYDEHGHGSGVGGVFKAGDAAGGGWIAEGYGGMERDITIELDLAEDNPPKMPKRGKHKVKHRPKPKKRNPETSTTSARIKAIAERLLHGG
jgi:hypothetical protein